MKELYPGESIVYLVAGIYVIFFQWAITTIPTYMYMNQPIQPFHNMLLFFSFAHIITRNPWDAFYLLCLFSLFGVVPSIIPFIFIV